MIKTCQKLLISALIVLQVVAPLVHAHTKTHGLHFGLHLPGLEFASEQHQQHLVLADSTVYLDEGVIISVSSGIKQNPVLVFFQQQDQDPAYLSVFSIPGVFAFPEKYVFDLPSGPLNPCHFCTARAPPSFKKP